ncbi:hypothetical protein SO694_00004165 [Aureococcus anophagefferens]|uniref:Uncharacterized protein n=1 Tax=Aureococcus anophagefferens TaxID=44056 RepID=A0ABR1G8Z0_AURAN
MALLLAARSARSFVARAPAVRPPSARAMSSSGSYDMEGTISKIGEVQTFESGFAKIEFVVTTEEMYPQEVKLPAGMGVKEMIAAAKAKEEAAKAAKAAPPKAPAPKGGGSSKKAAPPAPEPPPAASSPGSVKERMAR